MNEDDAQWQPTADLKCLQARAELNQAIRLFFAQRQVLEVETPILGQAATVDPFIESLDVNVLGRDYYLQTSPEFFLKRLLCAGSGDIYSLAKAFRQGEKGRRHQPEFTLLEWYRVGWDEHRLMDEVVALMQLFFPDVAVFKYSYQALFQQHTSIDPHAATIEQLSNFAAQQMTAEINDAHTIDKNTWLDIIMSQYIEPRLPQQLVLVHDYPASQAALAQLGNNAQGQIIARRFEVYLNRLELANGYFELTDADEQQQRFEQDVAYRKHHYLPIMPYDKQLVAALRSGMPRCAGVALGVDRLLMQVCALDNITQAISFTNE